MEDRSRNHRRGAAIILVLVCLLALSSLVLGNQEIAFKGAFSARLLAEEYKADLMAESALNAAIVLLEQDETYEDDTQFERWARPWGIDGVSIHIVPTNAKLDVNLISGGERFAEGLALLTQKAGKTERRLAALKDWLDKDDKELFPGSEGAVYMRIWPPYSPRNKKLESYGELSLVSGWRDAAAQFADDLTVFGGNRVNLNFVSRKVFVALFPEIDDSWRQLVSWRESRGFTSVTQLREAIPGLASDDELFADLLEYVTVESRTFEVIVEVDLPLVYEKRRYIVKRNQDEFRKKPSEVLQSNLLEVRYKDDL